VRGGARGLSEYDRFRIVAEDIARGKPDADVGWLGVSPVSGKCRMLVRVATLTEIRDVRRWLAERDSHAEEVARQAVLF
jgi:hypothetical protein